MDTDDIIEALTLALHDIDPIGWVLVVDTDTESEAIGPYENPHDANKAQERLRSELPVAVSVRVMPLFDTGTAES